MLVFGQALTELYSVPGENERSRLLATLEEAWD